MGRYKPPKFWGSRKLTEIFISGMFEHAKQPFGQPQDILLSCTANPKTV